MPGNEAREGSDWRIREREIEGVLLVKCIALNCVKVRQGGTGLVRLAEHASSTERTILPGNSV